MQNVALENVLLHVSLNNFFEKNYSESSKSCAAVCNKISFLAISSKITILGHMLLHKLYINVAIANILLYPKSFYDLPEPKYQEFSKFDAAMPKKSVFWPYLRN